MTWTSEQIRAAKDLARVMKEKGVRWEWEQWDFFISLRENRIKVVLTPAEADHLCSTFVQEAIPLPTFERCLEVLEKWGWRFGYLDCPGQTSSVINPYELCVRTPGPRSAEEANEVKEEFIRTTGPDPTTCAIKAVEEVVRRKGE